MARLNDAQRAALANWWDLAQTAASGGYTATDVTAVASDLAAQAGRSLGFAEASAIAQLYGYARRMTNAADVFQGAPPDAQVTPDMIGIPPWARDQVEMNTTPLWHGTFEFTFIDQAGNVQTEFRTSAFPMTLPDTVGEIADAMQADAEAMAAKYEVQLIDINPIQLLAV